MSTRFPELKLLTGGIMLGAPDLCLPVPRSRFYGLCIQLSSEELAPEQRDRADSLQLNGYCFKVCGCDAHAWDALSRYLQQLPLDGLYDY